MHMSMFNYLHIYYLFFVGCFDCFILNVCMFNRYGKWCVGVLLLDWTENDYEVRDVIDWDNQMINLWHHDVHSKKTSILIQFNAVWLTSK